MADELHQHQLALQLTQQKLATAQNDLTTLRTDHTRKLQEVQGEEERERTHLRKELAEGEAKLSQVQDELVGCREDTKKVHIWGRG